MEAKLLFTLQTERFGRLSELLDLPFNRENRPLLMLPLAGNFMFLFVPHFYYYFLLWQSTISAYQHNNFEHFFATKCLYW